MKNVSHPDILTSDGKTKDIAIAASGSVVYTMAFKLAYGEYFSLFYKVTSSGTVNLKIEIEQCWRLPTTEGSADTSYVVPQGMSIIDTVTVETQRCKSISPIPSVYARFKLTALSGNDASNTIRLRLGKQEDTR